MREGLIQAVIVLHDSLTLAPYTIYFSPSQTSRLKCTKVVPILFLSVQSLLNFICKYYLKPAVLNSSGNDRFVTIVVACVLPPRGPVSQSRDLCPRGCTLVVTIGLRGHAVPQISGCVVTLSHKHQIQHSDRLC